MCMSLRKASQHTVDGSKGQKYSVEFSEDVQDWHCTCRAFQFYNGHCKHIKKIISENPCCDWTGENPDLDHDGANICPQCGGPVTAEINLESMLDG